MVFEVPSTCPAESGNEMRLGSEGSNVMSWQRFLNTFVEAGVLVESCRLTVDGKFGKTTHIATLAYQIREMILLSPNNGGDGAGIVGPHTQIQAIKQGWNQHLCESVHPSNHENR